MSLPVRTPTPLPEVAPLPEEKPRISDILLILIGNRGAIQRLSGSLHTLAIGALLIITAGLARNYDHHYLLREWQWLYGPFIASIISSFIIFLLGCSRHLFHQARHPYFTFLSLYWMTAPCAWLYAIPIESFTDIVTATKWNIAFLAIVSLWRVLLVSRFLSVMSGEKFLISFVRIAWPAAVIMCVASFKIGIELVGIMGGIKLEDHEVILSNAAGFTTAFCFFAAIILALAHFIIFLNRTKLPSPTPLPWRDSSIRSHLRVYAAAIAIVTASLLTVYLLPFQNQAKNNYHLRQLLSQKRYSQAIEYVATRERHDFLEHHSFPASKTDRKSRFDLTQLPINIQNKAPAWLLLEWKKSPKEEEY